MDENTLNLILEISKFALPGVILPLLILWQNNRHNRQIKQLEQKFELEKLETAKKLDKKYNVETEKRIHEKEVYACLVKILFEVQKLHIDLSGNCVNYNCIHDAVTGFKSSLTKYQEKIADNQIHLTAECTNNLYGFYQQIGELLIELKEIQDQKKFHIAIASVYFRARQLAMGVLALRFVFIPEELEKITEEQVEKEFKNFISCCGNAPTREITKEYKEFIPTEEAMEKTLDEFTTDTIDEK